LKEILRRYNKPDKEVIESALKNDEQLQRAVNIIKDKGFYDSLLKAK
jgi:hypothetical protein